MTTNRTQTAKKTPSAVVVGGGIGGLTAAALLARAGLDVTLLEKNATVGGKLQDVTLGSYRFDFGPSTITMPWLFERVFELCGVPVDPELRFRRLDVHTRNRFPDGSIVDLTADPERMDEALKDFSAEDRRGFRSFLEETGRIQRIAERHFFRNPFSHWRDYVSPSLAAAFAQVRPFQSMDAFHRTYFRDPRLLTMMNRYATYVGSEPLRTPATLSMIAYAELVGGVYYVNGGNYRLVEAFRRLAERLGVRIVVGATVDAIETANGAVRGVRLAANDAYYPADVVVSNVDVEATERLLHLPTRNAKKPERSVSGFLTLAGTRKAYPDLRHHNLFYPDPAVYGEEFLDLFEHRRWPADPAVYVCHSGFSEPERAAGGSNLYVLVNVPAGASTDAAARNEAYRRFIVDRLERRYGFDGLASSIEEIVSYGPEDIERLTGAVNGALYGGASHGWRDTFFRPSVRARRPVGMYYAGGTTHPGGGTPMVALSGAFAATAALRDIGRPTYTL
ncbi:phytoene desaturase family protein [Paenibacillus sp. TRM 82003]|nr:phytoene desaturase family protein [Paenibacillus sp. TRM 82003]